MIDIVLAATHNLAENGVPGVNITPVAPPGSNKLNTILSWGVWIAFFCCIGAFIYNAVKLGWERSQGTLTSEASAKIVMTLIGSSLIGSATGIIGVLM